MKDFMDRQPTVPGRRKITYPDGHEEFVTVEMADEPTREGTPLNREMFMEAQGFGTYETIFNDDGSIDEINARGEVFSVIFNEDDDTVIEKFTNADGVAIMQKIDFTENNKITQTLISGE